MALPKRRDPATRVLAVENLTAKVLRQSVDQVVARASASRMAPNYAALVVQATATLAITKAHEAARSKAADVFEAQTGIEAADDVGEDRERAQQAASGLAKAFRENIGEHLAAGLAVKAAYTAAMHDLRPNIERTATTEVMAAWNGEVRRQARVARTEVTQTWNAELDACDACAGFGGMTIRADEVFPDGDPPLHPHCRCTIDSRVVREPEESETRIRAAEPAARPFVAPEFTNPPPLPAPTRWSQKALLDDAIAKANDRGVIHMNYIRGSMRDMKEHRAAYAGATAKEVEAIATGRMPAKNSGRTLPPIKVTLDTGELVLQDGRHRMTVAIEAGAQNISAVVRTYTKSGKSISRETKLSLRGITH